MNMHERTHRITGRRGFTLVEVLSCVMILGFGLAAVIGMFAYGGRLARKAGAEATAWLTARSVATTANLAGPAVLSWDGTQGYVNGYWTTRKEVSSTTLPGGLKQSTVRADVFDSQSGVLLASETRTELHR